MAENKVKSVDAYQLKTPKKELDEARVLELINAYVNSPSFRVLSGSPTLSGLIVTGQIESTLASGTSPFVVASSTKVTNLNADSVDGFSLDQTVTTAGSPTFVAVTTTGALNIGTDLNHDGTKIGFFTIAPVTRATAYTQTYATADKTFSAYASDPESGAYTGIDNAQGGSVYATVADLNALRVAYETLRVHTEDNSAITNSVIDDLQSYGLLQ